MSFTFFGKKCIINFRIKGRRMKMVKDHESEEMYLETILRLKSTKPNLRSVDIVEALGYAKSSVSSAVNKLVRKGYISINNNGEISLTESGKQKADAVYERHRIITALFIKLGAEPQSAEQNACRVEHVLTEDVFELIKQYVGKSE